MPLEVDHRKFDTDSIWVLNRAVGIQVVTDSDSFQQEHALIALGHSPALREMYDRLGLTRFFSRQFGITPDTTQPFQTYQFKDLNTTDELKRLLMAAASLPGRATPFDLADTFAQHEEGRLRGYAEMAGRLQSPEALIREIQLARRAYTHRLPEAAPMKIA